MKKPNFTFFKSDLILYALLLVQIFFWTYSKEYKPKLGIVPPVPSQASVKAFSFGDEQFYFRTLAFKLQNAGDTFGRFTALKLYDYNRLYHWFKLLDSLDEKSNFVPSLAGYYYSQTQNTPDVIYVINYLAEHARKDMYHKWWWMSQAVYLANFKLKDKDLALKLAKELANTPREDVPIWVKQMPAFIHEQRGEFDQAYEIIRGIADNIESFDPGEINFMVHFIEERLNKIIEKDSKLEDLKKQRRNP